MFHSSILLVVSCGQDSGLLGIPHPTQFSLPSCSGSKFTAEEAVLGQETDSQQTLTSCKPDTCQASQSMWTGRDRGAWVEEGTWAV
jgi:hypothetical protein